MILNSDPAKTLRDFQPQKHFFVGIDSDGCVFDTMELKQKECFIPNIIKHWHLQAVSKYVRETAEFVNLYSQWRGINRWPALIKVFVLLAERKEVINRGVEIPVVPSLRRWIETETALSNPALKKEIEQTNDPVLTQALRWSEAVNASIAEMVRNVPPFDYVIKSLAKITAVADVIVVSQTPTEALMREWEEHNLSHWPQVIAGQEMGSKTDHLTMAGEAKYPPAHVLMIGDAPGDRQAARDNNALFYPIVPGREEESWQRLYEHDFAKFINGQYAGSYEKQLNEEFDRYLPAPPPWEQ